MALVQTEHAQFVRDTYSKALMCTDAEEMVRSRATRASVRRTMKHQQDVNTRFANIDERLDALTVQLQQMSRNVELLVASYRTP